MRVPFLLVAVAVVFLALCAPLAIAQSVTGTWSFCGVVQGANFYSVTSALLSSNSTSPLTYNGQQAFFAVAGSSCTGYRSFYNLTQGSSPVLQQNASILSLAPPGSTGGNNNYFYPYSQPELDGDGLTFTFNVIPLIEGQPETAAAGASTSMNFWFVSGQYDEETQGGTHESPAWASSLSIAPVAVGTTVLPTCGPAASVQFSFCYLLLGSSYSVVASGTLTTTGVPQPFAASASNELTQTEQGVSVTAASGVRLYTNVQTGATTTLGVVSLAPVGSFVGNGNMLYPNGPLITDWNGIAFVMNGTVPIAGQTSTASELVFWWEGSVNEYLEESAGSSHESTPTYSSFVVQPYSPISGGSLSCQLPTLATTASITFTFCSQLVAPTWTSVMSGTLTASNAPVVTNGAVAYLITGAVGVRYFTNLSTGVVTTNYIQSLAAVGQLGGNDNLLYYNSSIALDGDGLTFVFDSQPPIAGQSDVDPSLQMNWWYSSPNYLEETAGGTHETAPTSSVVTVQLASAGAPLPICLAPMTSALAAGTSQWAVCSYLLATTFTSALTTVITANSTQLSIDGVTGYYAMSGPVTGSRFYQDLTGGTTQLAIITQLDPPGSTGGNDNYFFPNSFPTLDGDGLTFRFNTPPLIASRDSTADDMNLWYTSGSYLEETAGGTHETTPVTSQVTFVPYSQASTGLGPQCLLPSSLSWSFCFGMVGPSWTVVFSGLANSSAIAQLIPSNSDNELTQSEQAFTITSATGTRTFTNLTTGTATTTSVVGMAPGFVGATQYLYYGYSQTTDWNGIAFQMSGTVAVAGEPNAGDTFVLWWEAAVSQYLEETASSHHETTPTYSSLTFQPYSGVAPSCAIPAQAQNVIYYSFCSVLQGNGWSSVMSGVLFASNVQLVEADYSGVLTAAYLVVGANGTRTFTSGGQTQVANIVGVAVPGSTGGNDNYLFVSSSIVLDGNGITFDFDVEPNIQGEPLGNTANHEMNWWFNYPTYLEETAGATHETTPTNSTVTIAPWTGGALPSCTVSSSLSASSSSSSSSASSFLSSASASASSAAAPSAVPSVSSASSSSGGVGAVNSQGSSSSSSGLSGGDIAGIVIGCVVGAALLLCLVLLAVMAMRRDTGKQRMRSEEESSQVSDGSRQRSEERSPSSHQSAIEIA